MAVIKPTAGRSDIDHIQGVSISAVSQNPYSAGSSTNITLPYTLNEALIFEKAKPNLYQKTTIVDMTKFAEAPDETMLKDKIREDLRFQMSKHLSENLMFTRTNDHANDTMTIHARCYVFTRDQLLDFARELNK